MKLVLPLLLLLCACDPKEYKCKAGNECVSTGGNRGLCLDMHCAFQDKSCTTGLRFDDTGGPVANECVPLSSIPRDAGPADAPAPSIDAGATVDASGAADAGAAADAGP